MNRQIGFIIGGGIACSTIIFDFQSKLKIVKGRYISISIGLYVSNRYIPELSIIIFLKLEKHYSQLSNETVGLTRQF